MTESALLFIIFVPLILILWLANMADKQRHTGQAQPVAAVLTYLILLGLWSGLFLSGVLLSVLGGILKQQPLSSALVQQYEQMGLSASTVTSLVAALPRLGMGLWIPALLAMVLLLPPVRRWLARVIPLDPGSVTHTVALSYTLLIVVNLWITMAIGLGNLAELTAVNEAPPVSSLINITWAQELLFLAMAMVGVGWLSRRDFTSVWRRLGIVRPSWREGGLGIVIGLGLVALIYPLEYWMSQTGIGVNEDVSRLSEQLIGPLTTTLPGILTLGLAAALGEEALFRGALQPRFGLIFTAALFALLHSTYGLTLSTVIVFALGLILGWVRNRYNTSTSMFVHATYNMALGLLSFLSLWPD